jgi:hypothetical protein
MTCLSANTLADPEGVKLSQGRDRVFRDLAAAGAGA